MIPKMIELEAKVRIEDEMSLLKKLKAGYSFLGTKEKSDTYYSPKKSTDKPVLRIREVDGKYEVTKKDQVLEDGIETNHEIDFSVSDIKAFISFLNSIGIIKTHEKQKRSHIFKSGPFVIELCEVKGLGWFLEIEIISTESDLEKNKHELEKIFLQFGFSSKNYVNKRYLDMIDKKA